MTRTYYELNMRFLKENALHLYNILLNDSPLHPDVNVEYIDGIPLNFVLSNSRSKCYLNSIHHIDSQIERLIKKVEEEVNLLVVFGFETGAFLESVFFERPELEHIVIIEPCLQLFRKLIELKDITEFFLKNKSVTIILNQPFEEASRLINYILMNSRNKKFCFIEQLTYRTIFGDEFNNIIELARDYFISDSVNFLTAYHTLHLYSYNFIKNQKHHYFLAESLFAELRKLTCPVVIVSAGPSLTDELELLRSLKNKVYIVAVGTAIRVLDVHGIKPHLRIAMDGFPSECIFEDIDTETVPLLYSEKIHADVLPKYSGTKYMMILNVDRITQFFYKDTGYSQVLARSGYSVANLALDLFSMLNFKKIILIGQDLCYKKEKQYAEGASTLYDLDLNGPGFVKVLNMDGESVNTTLQFLSMRNLFERIIPQFPNTKVYNVTKGGIEIRGAISTSFREVAEGFVECLDIEGVNQRAQSGKITKATYENKIKENYTIFKKEISEIIEINNERVNYLKKYAEQEVTLNISEKEMKGFEQGLVRFNKQFNKVNVYTQVVYPSLEHIIFGLKDSYAYNGERINLKMQSLYKSVLAETTEVHRYALLLNELKCELDY